MKSLSARDVHVTLDENDFRRLSDLSRKLKLSRNSLVREAVSDFVARREREWIEREMARYADEVGPHSGDFVGETDLAVVQTLLEQTEW